MLSIARKSKWLCSSSVSCGQVEPPYSPNTYKNHVHSFHHFTVRHDEVQRSFPQHRCKSDFLFTSSGTFWDPPSLSVRQLNCKRTVLVIVVFTKVLFCDLDYVLFTTGMTSLRTGSPCDLSSTECFGTYYYLHPKTKLALLYLNVCQSRRGKICIVCYECSWFLQNMILPQGLVHHGPIPDTADGAKGHKGEPCQ